MNSNEEILLLKDAIEDICLYLGESHKKPISVSKLFLELGMTKDMKDHAFAAFLKMSEVFEEEGKKLTLSDCRDLIERFCSTPDGFELSDIIIEEITRGFALWIPELSELIKDWE